MTHSGNIVGRRYDTTEAVSITITGETISAIRSLPEAARQNDLPWIAPALIDIQINGYGGQEFSSPDLTPEAVARVVRRQFASGVARLCPTLTTNSHAVLRHGMETIRAACERWPDVNRAVFGIHLEGPYFSTEDGPRGAHPAEHCRRPDWDELTLLQVAAGGRLKILTMSPEFDNAPQFIANATAAGLIVAIGHTGASGAQIRAAVEAGARLSTHLGNGAHRVLRRHPNYIWDQLAEDRLWASLIVDAHHLPPEVVQTFLRAKTPARCLLVSDLSGLAGLPPGRYPSSGCELEILTDGRLVIAGQDQLLAGASQPLHLGIANVMRFAGLDLKTAVGLATRQPAALLGLSPPEIEVGEPADFVLFDLPDDLRRADAPRRQDGLNIRQTIIAGREILTIGQLS
ncbi:MAG TPA: amidohydrolase family protein [Pirellulales bacterium]